MKGVLIHLRTPFQPLRLFSVLSSLALCAADEAPQEAWVARWNLAEPKTVCRVLGMKADGEGNLLVAGDLIETNGATRYLLLKFAPSGQLLWATNYASTNAISNTVRGFATDAEGNALLTGTSETVKFSPQGQLLWASPYAGTDVAVDREGNALVTGFSTQNVTIAKLARSGTNLWLRTEMSEPGNPEYVSYSRKVAVNERGEVFVAGFEIFLVDKRPDGRVFRYWRSSLFKYDREGLRLWEHNWPSNGSYLIGTWDIYDLLTYANGSVSVIRREGLAHHDSGANFSGGIARQCRQL